MTRWNISRGFVPRCQALPVGLLLIATALLPSGPLRAEVTLGSPFTSHMVLQRDRRVPVWGWADPSEKVTVEFAGQTKTATAGADGGWRIELGPFPASANARALTVKGSKTTAAVALEDVLVGEVWIASGQSNMDFPMSKSVARWAGVDNEEQEIAAAHFPEIRMFTAQPIRANTPQEKVPGEWRVCSPATVPGFSAIGYFFARDLHRELKVPIGIVTLTFGASTAQAWIRREAIAADPLLKGELDRFDETVKNYTPPSEEELAAWRAAVEKARAEGKRAPGRPKPHPAQDQHNPTVLFNGVVAPVVPFAARGVLWYQGESITGPREWFPRWNELLITDWRKLWGSELPFYFCQLAAYNKHNPAVREMQAEALKLPNTAMVVTIDIGHPTDVHPHNKQDVGARLARVALARNYGRKIEYSGPVFAGAKVEAGAIRVKFSHVGGGLVAKNGPLKTFEIAGADGTYVPAEATIEGDTVVVRTAGVTAPVSVRYAWTNYPEGANLFNGAGLPAAPFRTGPSAPPASARAR